jgi:DNA polymerase I-like protein with 3'-5' exonuclease and polymerase domains
MGSIDYSSQEFLLAALLSGDKRMLEAYIEGDVYLYFAKQSKMVPKDATKESHKKERDLAKSTVLGISYSMTCVGLSRKLSSDVGYYVSEEEAQKYIDNFNEIFSVFYEWKKNQVDLYQMRKYVKLLDGFYMFGNNPNERSLTNMPIQGMGAVILRKAIQLAQDNNITVVAPLHDALYIMFHKSDVTSMDRLAKAMVDAFCFYFPERVKESAKVIRLEAEVWGGDVDHSVKYTVSDMPLSVEKVHIDPRGKREYEQFKQYFDTDVCGDLL